MVVFIRCLFTRCLFIRCLFIRSTRLTRQSAVLHASVMPFLAYTIYIQMTKTEITQLGDWLWSAPIEGETDWPNCWESSSWSPNSTDLYFWYLFLLTDTDKCKRHSRPNCRESTNLNLNLLSTYEWFCCQFICFHIFRLTWFGDNTIFCHSDVSSLSPLFVAPVWSVFTLPLICTLRMGLLSPAPFSQLLWTQTHLFWQLNQKPPQRFWRRNKPSWFGTDSRHPLHLVETNILNSKCIQLTYIFRKVYSEI